MECTQIAPAPQYGPPLAQVKKRARPPFPIGAPSWRDHTAMARNGTKETGKREDGIPLAALALAFAILAAAAAVLPRLF